MKKTIGAIAVAGLLVATLAACPASPACAKPGAPAPAPRPAAPAPKANTGGGYKAPVSKHTTKSKPKVKVDDDFFEGDDNPEVESCDD